MLLGSESTIQSTVAVTAPNTATEPKISFETGGHGLENLVSTVKSQINDEERLTNFYDHFTTTTTTQLETHNSTAEFSTHAQIEGLSFINSNIRYIIIASVLVIIVVGLTCLVVALMMCITAKKMKRNGEKSQEVVIEPDLEGSSLTVGLTQQL